MSNTSAEQLQLDNKKIARTYRRLLRKSQSILNEGDLKSIRRAFYTSLEAHKGMRRKSGEPYIIHPLEVAEICVSEIGLGTTSVIAALLHDVVEDTDYVLENIEPLFGKKVSEIIDGLTKISGVFEYGSSQQATNFRKMLLSLSKDLRVILIKLADRLHNMRTLEHMPRDKQLKIANETIYLYAPLAHRLGLYAIKSELEDLYLKYSDRRAFQNIVEKINSVKYAKNRQIRNFIKPIQAKLNELNIKYTIKWRAKSVHSIWKKMQNQGVPFEKIYDLMAVRIILDIPIESEKSYCWQAYSLVTDYYQPNPDRLRDWLSTPKANGYESLHTTVMSDKGQWVEVQIRTKRMDDIAEKGYAAHWKYKHVQQTDDKGLDMWIAKVREALQQNNTNAIEFVDDFRSNLYSDEVFVFTPKGDLRTLAQGATVLDFAFDIHTEIGVHCLGAKVNQKLVQLNYILKNGDQIQILTSKKQKPNENWLNFVISSKAKSKIKDALKDEKNVFIEKGKEIIKRKLKQLKLTYSQDVLEQMVLHFDAKTSHDFMYLIGTRKIDHTLIKSFVFSEKKIYRPKKVHNVKALQEKLKNVRKKDQDLILLGTDMEILEYTFSKCCNPISGDDVFGFVTRTEGIKIHRTTCPNAAKLLSHYGYRVVKAKWVPSHNQSYEFETNLSLLGTDRIGLINDITNIISEELEINMKSISIRTENGTFEGIIQLLIKDTRHLDMLVEKLKKVNGLLEVIRTQ